MLIRYATAEDADAILAIYTPYILNTFVTFEITVPTGQAFKQRVRDICGKYPYFVCVEDGRVVGYAYASPYGQREAYRYTVDASVYVEESYHRRGIATALYRRLIDELKSRGFYTLHVLVALPNPQSIGFHTAMGFKLCGTSHNAGRKMGRWIDLADLELPLAEYGTPADEK